MVNKKTLILAAVIYVGWMYGGILRGAEIDQLLDAIAVVESGNNANAIGDGGKAVGVYQLWEVYVKDVNRFAHTTYTSKDRYNPVKSREITQLYITHYGAGKSIEAQARIHNGGPKGHKKAATLKYWRKIQKAMKVPSK